MEFFDKLGKKASEAYKVTADKTGKIAKETKIKFKMSELKGQINDIYEDIGKKVYEKHVTEEEVSINKYLEEQCIKIDVISDEIETLLKESLELKDRKQCMNCYKEIEKEYCYCPNCGAEQSKEDIAREVEIVEDVEENKVEEELENQIIFEDLEENDNEKIEESEKTNLEKTVEVESNVEIDAKNNELR